MPARAALPRPASCGPFGTIGGIESRDHHVRDRVPGGDESRIRGKPGLVARLRFFALNTPRANGAGNVRQALCANALSLGRPLARPVG